MNDNQVNFEKLLKANVCLDEYSQVDEKMVSDKIEHLELMVQKLYIYTWVFFGLVWLPASTPILFCIVFRLFKT